HLLGQAVRRDPQRGSVDSEGAAGGVAAEVVGVAGEGGRRLIHAGVGRGRGRGGDGAVDAPVGHRRGAALRVGPEAGPGGGSPLRAAVVGQIGHGGACEIHHRVGLGDGEGSGFGTAAVVGVAGKGGRHLILSGVGRGRRRGGVVGAVDAHVG